MIAKAKKIAYGHLDGLRYEIKPSPLETLATIDFEMECAQTMDQSEVTLWNLNLDKRGCLGRVAQAAAVVEKHFPGVKIEIGEVWQDFLATLMLDMLSENRARAYEPSFMMELMMYEDPHLVLFVDGVQFDPLSIELGHEIFHPRVGKFPLWGAVAASMLIAKTHLEPDSEKKLILLDEAEKICPGMVTIRENRCEPLELLGRMDEVIQTAKWCFKRRPCARTLYVLYHFTRDKKYLDILLEKYTKEVVKYF